MYSIGIDLGSSSIKASILNLKDATIIAADNYPKEEMDIVAVKFGWAEQEPETWWNNIKILLKKLISESKIDSQQIKYIGISYQMHGLVTIDDKGKVLRPSIIWCDSRAVNIGKEAFDKLGDNILSSLLNSPGNFTASKLRWVKENEPDIYSKIHKIMLPGDFVAYKLTNNIYTTKSGLSEGIMWDFKKNKISDTLLDYYEIDKKLIPDIVDTFSNQGEISKHIADELGLSYDTIVSYRAGDQPNNALSLNVLEPGEVAATAGTSGVVYGVSDEVKFDKKSRVNTFAHVNHSETNTRLGVLLNINGTGIANSWMRKNLSGKNSYDEINKLASEIKEGSDGVLVYPYGNGAERMFENQDLGARIENLNFNIHNQSHIFRATQESIAFSFKYGMEIMEQTGINTSVIKAGYSNMFLSNVFAQTLANVSNTTIELYNTDGSQGAARAAAYGGGFYMNRKEAFAKMELIKTIKPNKRSNIIEYYNNWKQKLNN